MTAKEALTIQPKVAGGVVGSQVALIIIWVVGHWWDVPPEVGFYIVSVAAALGGWLSPDKET